MTLVKLVQKREIEGADLEEPVTDLYCVYNMVFVESVQERQIEGSEELVTDWRGGVAD